MIYDVVNNLVKQRCDSRNNQVDYYVTGGNNTLSDFQWGRDVVTYNVLQGQSIWGATNSSCTFTANILNSGKIVDTTASNVTLGSYVSNIIEQSSYINITKNSGTVNQNILNNASYIVIVNVINEQQVIQNELNETSYISINTLSSGALNNNNLYSFSLLTDAMIITAPRYHHGFQSRNTTTHVVRNRIVRL